MKYFIMFVIPYDLINIYSVKDYVLVFFILGIVILGSKGPEKINATEFTLTEVSNEFF